MVYRPDPSRRASRRPVTDRWAFKPVALLLLLATVAASSAAAAVLLSPPFVGLGMAIQELGRRLDEAGADFTRIPAFPQRSTIYANDGRTVLAHVYLDNREIVPLSEISPAFANAALAIEDSTFYEHGAINLSSMLRALSENLRAGEVVQGGSTITQQLVKNTLGLDPIDQSIERKFQEAALALKVEQRYDKDKILAMYLNQVFLGNNVYGVATASQFYFNKPPSDLTLAEGAMLAGMIRAPAYYDPLERPHKAWLRRNDVLNRMIALGPSWLKPRRGEKVKSSPLGLAENVGEVTLPNPPFIVSYVRDQINEDPNGWYTVLGDTPKERERSLSEGGLQIVTTLDPQWQRAAQRAADLPWANAPSNPNRKPPADLGIVSIENDTGAIRTMLSGKSFDEDEIDTVTTPHQPGSSFKPYILAAAFEAGVVPTARYSGDQTAITDPRCTTNGQPWYPLNAEGYSRGYLDLYTATADSVNLVFVRLILDAGLQETVDMAHRMGVLSPLPPVCALGTGSVGISPLDQASGYQTIANEGVHCEPFAVAEIRKGDQLLYTHRPDCERVLNRTIANVITDMMVGVVDHGTASGVFSSGWGPWPTAGKTGTANENTNVWFAGFTEQVTTAVWVGSQGVPFPLSEYFGEDVFGSTVAAPVWKAYMLEVMEGMDPIEFPEPELVPVPGVIGLSEEAARGALREARLKVVVKSLDSYLPAGTVTGQLPTGGTLTFPGATVTIFISTGEAPVSSVPNVVGMNRAEAIAVLRASNFFAGVVEETTKDEEQDGIVLSQVPEPGTRLPEGSTVTIDVWVFEEKGGGSPSPSPTPSPSPNPNPNPPNPNPNPPNPNP